MTTVRTRADEIFAKEGFSVCIRHNTEARKKVSMERNGVIGAYNKAKKTSGRTTVSQWKTKFELNNPGYTCDILLADGTVAAGQTLLETVRKSY
ncbi:hypothetical protein LPB41_19870 [Thalassospira sp. MA62]|nr:hypothetical protein [Thalassospira sp. MA62]